jgi:hypothetical protein
MRADNFYWHVCAVRAALAAALWADGARAAAESEWDRVDDPRYRDRAWLRRDRRWPPALAGARAAAAQQPHPPACLRRARSTRKALTRLFAVLPTR